MTTSVQASAPPGEQLAAYGGVCSSAAPDPRRLLNRLVHATGAAFQPILFTPAQHVVTGVFIGSDGGGHHAHLFYNCRSRIAGLVLNLRSSGALSSGQMVCLLRLQGSAQLARLDYEPEDSTVVLHARSVWLTTQNPALVLAPIIKDIRNVLADDRLHALAA